MSIKGIRRMLVGEEMPDKNAPKYKERNEKEVAAGRKFAKTTRIDRAAAKVQGFANHPKSRLVQKIESGDRNIHNDYIRFCRYKGKVVPSIRKRRKVELLLLYQK